MLARTFRCFSALGRSFNSKASLPARYRAFFLVLAVAVGDFLNGHLVMVHRQTVLFNALETFAQGQQAHAFAAGIVAGDLKLLDRLAVLPQELILHPEVVFERQVSRKSLRTMFRDVQEFLVKCLVDFLSSTLASSLPLSLARLSAWR